MCVAPNNMQVWPHTNTHTHVHTSTLSHIHTHTHTHTHTCVHARTQIISILTNVVCSKLSSLKTNKNVQKKYKRVRDCDWTAKWLSKLHTLSSKPSPAQDFPL